MKKIKYTKEIEDYYLKNYEGKSNIEMANELNLKFGLNVNNLSITNFRSNLKRRKNIVLKPAKNDGCIKKGNIPKNKGKKWNEYLSQEAQLICRQTTFKKGNVPPNCKPLLSERINIDGYVEIKVKEPNIWKAKHRYLYEKVKGPIPKGYNLIFLDGNKQNLDLSNLKLISKSENLIMNRNKLYAPNKELTESGVLIARVINKVNKSAKN